MPPQDLAAWNAQYTAKFGHVFLICAAGLDAPRMLVSLKARYGPEGLQHQGTVPEFSS